MNQPDRLGLVFGTLRFNQCYGFRQCAAVAAMDLGDECSNLGFFGWRDVHFVGL